MGKEKKIKSVIVDIIRVDLLFLVLFLPLIFVLITTELSVKFVFDLPPGIDIEYAFLFLIAIGKFISYFFGKYGSAFKLPFLSLIRDDVIQSLDKNQNIQKSLSDIQMALIAGSAMYFVVIISLLAILINTPLVLSKIVVGIVVVLLLIYVLPNKKHENVAKLIKKFGGKRKYRDDSEK